MFALSCDLSISLHNLKSRGGKRIFKGNEKCIQNGTCYYKMPALSIHNLKGGTEIEGKSEKANNIQNM